MSRSSGWGGGQGAAARRSEPVFAPPPNESGMARDVVAEAKATLREGQTLRQFFTNPTEAGRLLHARLSGSEKELIRAASEAEPTEQVGWSNPSLEA